MTDAFPSKILNLGLIGAGVWGRNFIKTIAGLDGARAPRVRQRRGAAAGECDRRRRREQRTLALDGLVADD